MNKRNINSCHLGETADQAYQRHRQESHDLLKRIQQKIVEVDLAQAQDPDNWNYPGDMAFFNQRLRAFLQSTPDDI